MEAPEEKSITIVASHSQSYADNNLNGKTLGTHYIYTTEGDLIPAMPEPAAQNIDITNSQHFDTAHISDVQGIHIHHVDFQQYEQQYTDNKAVHETPIVGQFVENQPEATFVMDQTNYIAQNQGDVIETSQTGVFDNSLVSSDNQNSNSYNFDTQVASYIEPTTSETVSQLVTNFDVKVEENANDLANNPEHKVCVSQSTESVVQSSDKSQQINSVRDPKDVMEVVDEIDKNLKHTQKIDLEKAETGSVSKEVQADPIDAIITESKEKETSTTAAVTPILENAAQNENENTTKSTEAMEEGSDNFEENHIEYISEDSEPEADPNALQIEEESQCASELSGTKNTGLSEIEAVEKEIIQQDGSMEIEEISLDRSEESTAQGEEELLIVYDDGNMPEAVEEKASYTVKITGGPIVKKEVQDNVPQRRPRGRRPKTEIPLHILGHDINKPVDNVVNGKSPKPRLGVKIPYRNLTSQIVSKEDIENEIVERGKKKQEKEILFARQLTARLAKKLAPKTNVTSTSTNNKLKDDTGKSKDAGDSGTLKDVEQEMRIIDSSSQSTNLKEDSLKEKTSEPIENNSDLLAILEGDDDHDTDKTKSKKVSSNLETDSTNDDKKNVSNEKKNMERLIALKQLQDLPYISPSTRFYLGRTCKTYMKELPSSLVEGVSQTSSKDADKQTTVNVKEKSSNKSSKSTETKRFPEIEPTIKVNTALKTYSRKRKSGDSTSDYLPEKKPPPPEVLDADELELKAQGINTPARNVYMTKSSRIIKKKVIWDPDEPSTRTILLKPSSSKATEAQQKSATKSSPKNENKESIEVLKKSTEKAAEKKVEAKVVKIEKKCEPISKKPVLQSLVVEKKVSPTHKPKKSRSEVDKLLGDEGAIKMLYELKNTDDAHDNRKRKNVISVEKTFKDLAKKANQIKSDLVNTSSVESPKSLRKKDGASISPAGSSKSATLVSTEITRQNSRDSTSTPPASPSFQCPHETSYLIRRRSSSSISSGDETVQSMELEDDTENILRKITADSSIKVKKVTKVIENKEQNDSDLKAQKKAELRIGQYHTFSVKKSNKSVYIDLHIQENTKCYFTSELLEELTTALNKISKEKDCNVVLIRSKHEKYFSLGLDYKSLISDKENERKEKAINLAEIVSDFIKCLLHFPKILIAGIQGECCGLAVTMLPLFDIVIASDNASFVTPYSTLGTIAEAGFLLTVPYITHHGLASDLLFVAQKLTADEAFRRGLISRLCWPEKYQDTVKSIMSSIIKGSRQSLDSTKKQLRSNIINLTEDAMEAMANQLIHHWTSSECQKSFGKLE